MEEITLNKNNILIVGDRHSIIEYAVNSGVKLIVVIGNGKMKEEHLKLLKKIKLILFILVIILWKLLRFLICVIMLLLFLILRKSYVLMKMMTLMILLKLANKTRYSYYPVLNKKENVMVL